VTAETLICVECRRDSEEGAPGWRAFLTVDDETAVYCPKCAEREFGDDGEED
jgi:hypothetical protein